MISNLRPEKWVRVNQLKVVVGGWEGKGKSAPERGFTCSNQQRACSGGTYRPIEERWGWRSGWRPTHERICKPGAVGGIEGYRGIRGTSLASYKYLALPGTFRPRDWWLAGGGQSVPTWLLYRKKQRIICDHQNYSCTFDMHDLI